MLAYSRGIRGSNGREPYLPFIYTFDGSMSRPTAIISFVFIVSFVSIISFVFNEPGMTNANRSGQGVPLQDIYRPEKVQLAYHRPSAAVHRNSEKVLGSSA